MPTGIAIALSLASPGITNCKRQYRREESATGSSYGAEPDRRVDPNPDPRVPRRPDAGADRRGLWVEQPRETGGVSSTKLANAVADRLGAVRSSCCGEDGPCSSLRGRIVLRLQLAPGGAVRGAEVGETTIYDRAFRRCLLGRARAWTLVGHSGGDVVEVSVPVRARFDSSDARPDAGRP